MSEKKQQAVAQPVIPTIKKGGYVGFEPAPYYGKMRGSQVVEAEDEREPRYIDGYEELRREALKAAKARSLPS